MSLETFESDVFYKSAVDEKRRPLPIIPTVFESLREYITCLHRPLLEEAKEDLSLAFKSSLCMSCNSVEIPPTDYHLRRSELHLSFQDKSSMERTFGNIFGAYTTEEYDENYSGYGCPP